MMLISTGNLIATIVAIFCFAIAAYFSILKVQSNSRIVFSNEDLLTDKRLLLSIVGNVFDVSDGEKYYGQGGGYSILSRRDCSKFYATGTTCDDDITGFESEQCEAVMQWLDFYNTLMLKA
jgi:hypothetical protein